MVMGDDSCSRGCGFKSLHRMDLTFFHIDLLKELYCFFEKTENKFKRWRDRPNILISGLSNRM